MFDRGARIRRRLIRAILQQFHSPRDLRRALRLRRLAEFGALQDCALAVVPCAFSDLVITFHGRRKGNLVFWRPNVNLSRRAQEIGAALCRCMRISFRGRRSTWDMVVVFGVLCFRGRRGES